jgi:hypothetical protein
VAQQQRGFDTAIEPQLRQAIFDDKSGGLRDGGVRQGLGGSIEHLAAQIQTGFG